VSQRTAMLIRLLPVVLLATLVPSSVTAAVGPAPVVPMETTPLASPEALEIASPETAARRYGRSPYRGTGRRDILR